MKQNTINQRLMFLKKFQWFIYSFIEIQPIFIRAVKMTVSVVLGGCSIISESWSPSSKLLAPYTRLIKLGKVMKFQHPIYYEDENNNKRNFENRQNDGLGSSSVNKNVIILVNLKSRLVIINNNRNIKMK